MKKLIAAVLLFISGIYGQDKTQTFLVARASVGNAQYHMLEVFQGRGRWIYPDAGYIDFNTPGTYREVFIGGGATVYKSTHFLLIEEGYIDQATGPAAESATYFQPWTLANLQVSEKMSWETVYFPYLPLNNTARVQQVVEHSKMERDFSRFKIGAGYAGYQFAHTSWEHKPFVTATIKTKAGDFEFWFQRVPENHAALQIRFQKIFQ